MDLIDIRDDLQTRNVIRFAQETRYHVNCIRTNKNEHVVMLTINGRVMAEKVFVGMESSPRIKEINRIRKLFKIEGFEE